MNKRAQNLHKAYKILNQCCNITWRVEFISISQIMLQSVLSTTDILVIWYLSADIEIGRYIVSANYCIGKLLFFQLN